MDYALFKFWFDIGQTVAICIVAIYGWLVNRERVTNARIVSLEQIVDRSVEAHADRLGRIEEQLKHVPTQGDIAGIYRRIDDVHGALRELGGKFDAYAKAQALMMEHMVERK